MSMGEFDLIQRYFSTLTPPAKTGVVIGVGDDAAVIDVPHGEQFVMSVDSLHEGVHFPKAVSPEVVAQRSVAANMSDLAAMGAMPRWCLLNLALPEMNEAWLEGFSKQLGNALKYFEVSLVGGDTVKADSLSVALTMTGSVPNGAMLTRSGAQDGDDVYVSGFLGEAGMGLRNYLQAPDPNQRVQQRFLYPVPRIVLGRMLRDIANACIDVSDGFLQDVEHIAKASQCQITIEVNKIHISNAMQALEKDKQTLLEFALNGGDDYELCFTAPSTAEEKIKSLSSALSLPITKIGKVTKNPEQVFGITCLDEHGEMLAFAKKGYQHFTGSE